MNSYIILTNRIPNNPYEIRKEYVLKPIELSDETWEDLTHTSHVPSSYKVVMSLPYIDKSSNAIFKDLTMFHSFILDDPDIYEYANDTFTWRKMFEESKLTICTSITGGMVDFDHFPVITVFDPFDILCKRRHELNEKQKEILKTRGWVLGSEDPMPTEEINYRNAFNLFTELKSHRRDRKLYDAVCLYVFTHGLHNLTQLYRNDDMLTAFYITILEGIAGRPAECAGKIHCLDCDREIKHDVESLESYLIKKFGEGFKKLRIIRNKFSHAGHYLNVLDQLYPIYDRLDQRKERLKEDLTDEQLFALSKDEKLDIKDVEKWDKYEKEIEKLRIIARRTLVEEFLKLYRVQSR